MKNILKFSIATGILLVAYLTTFGAPTQLKSVIPFLAGNDASQNDQAAAKPASGRKSRASSVVIQPLELKPYTATIQTIGNAKSWNSVEATAEASGRVTEIFLQANAEVEPGAELVRLDNRTETLELQKAHAQLKQAQSLVAKYKKVRQSGISSVTDLIMDEAILAATQARVAVGLAEVALEERTIRAPIAGRLGLADIAVGDMLNESDIVVTIDDSRNLLIEFEVPERAVSLLSVGRKVLASTPSFAGQVFEAEITAFDSRLDSATRSVSVQAKLDNSADQLWSGMTFAVRLLNESEPMATVPATALSWARHGAGIWVVEDGKAARQPVTVRFRQGGTVWVDTAVVAGTTVVTEGAVKLREGSLVNPIPSVASSDAPLTGTTPAGKTVQNDAESDSTS